LKAVNNQGKFVPKDENLFRKKNVALVRSYVRTLNTRAMPKKNGRKTLPVGKKTKKSLLIPIFYFHPPCSFYQVKKDWAVF